MSNRITCNCVECRTKSKKAPNVTTPNNEPYTKYGSVLWYKRDLGYGFASVPGVGMFFFHHSSVKIEGFNKKSKLKRNKRLNITFKGTCKHPKTKVVRANLISVEER